MAHNEDLRAKSLLLQLTGSGDIDIGAGRISTAPCVAFLVEAARGPEARAIDQRTGVAIPLSWTGPLEDTRYEIDGAVAAQQAPKAGAAEEVEKRLAPRLEHRAREALKGLLSR